MKKIEIKKYLKYLGIKKFYPMKYKKCEVCNGKKTKKIISKVSWGNKKFGKLPVHCCLNCGFLFQNPRFDKNFYYEFYRNQYRNLTLKSLKPSKKFLNDQKKRGDFLYKFLKKFIPKKGTILDVGCSTGLMLMPFKKRGWICLGNDPVVSHIEYSKKKYKLNLEAIQSENMKLKKNSIDLIIIMGSLEHAYDANVVMKKCENAIKKGGILVLEANGDPLGYSKNYFNHNHHRYFFKNTMELMMRKYGWEPLLSTRYPITGPTRPNTQFCIGVYRGQKIKNSFRNLIKMGKKETYLDLFYKFKYHDYYAKNIKYLTSFI